MLIQPSPRTRRSSPPREPNAGTTSSAPERILDAAESVFASKGYYAATIRSITQVAGVPLNLARYHFGSKDQLFRQVLARRADESCGQIEVELAKATAGDTPPSLEAVVGAVLSLTVDRLSAGDDGWRNYLRLLSNMTSLQARPELLAPWRERYMPTAALMRSALRAALPQASENAISMGLHFLHTMAGHAVLDFAITSYIAGGGIPEQIDWDTLRQHMVTHCVGGLRAQVALPHK